MTQEGGGLALGAAAELVGDDAAFGEVAQRLPQCGGQRDDAGVAALDVLRRIPANVATWGQI